MLIIAARELKSIFLSPLAWVVLAVFQVVLAYMFLIQMETFVQWQPRLASLPNAPGLTAMVVAPLFNRAAQMMLMVVPILTMRLVSEELKSGTFTLLITSPRSMTEVVLGKFIAVLSFLGVVLALIALTALLLLLGGNLDLGLLAACVVGLLLLLASFAAAGLFISTLTPQPVAAAAVTFGLLLLLWMIDFAASASESGASGLLSYLSLSNHINSFLRGEFDSRDAIYYLLFTASFLLLAIRRLDGLRLQR